MDEDCKTCLSAKKSKKGGRTVKHRKDRKISSKKHSDGNEITNANLLSKVKQLSAKLEPIGGWGNEFMPSL